MGWPPRKKKENKSRRRRAGLAEAGVAARGLWHQLRRRATQQMGRWGGLVGFFRGLPFEVGSNFEFCFFFCSFGSVEISGSGGCKRRTIPRVVKGTLKD